MDQLNLYTRICSLDALNEERKDNQLVVYTAEYGESTGTNRLGIEAIIKDGVVIAKGDNNNAIPEDGIVLSGVGLAKDWIDECVPLDAKVVFHPSTMTIEIIG